MIQMSLSALAKKLGCRAPVEEIYFKGISHDSRTIVPGNLFMAIRGDQFDGHNFIEQALKKGAVAAIVSHHTPLPISQLIVPNTLDAFGSISQLWREHFSIPIIAVTGSNGKTTLKNMIASILHAACHNDMTPVLATEGNLNNNIGVPMMLSRLNAQHRYAVIEMGMNHFGEIAYLTRLTHPRVAIINNAGSAHLEGVKDIAGVARAKGEIFLGLTKDGVAILNRDDAYYEYWCGLVTSHQILTFGLEHTCDVTATILENQKILLQTPAGKIEVILPLLGKHNVMNALAATASALAVSIDLAAIKIGLENVSPAKGRMCQHFLINGARIIDDTYNANPFSLTAAVNTLVSLPGKKIVVLGDMKELGSTEKRLHFISGEQMRQAGVDFLFTLGEVAEETAKGFGDNAQHFTERKKLVAALHPYLTPDANVLIKGSRFMQMEKVVADILPTHQVENTH